MAVFVREDGGFSAKSVVTDGDVPGVDRPTKNGQHAFNRAGPSFLATFPGNPGSPRPTRNTADSWLVLNVSEVSVPWDVRLDMVEHLPVVHRLPISSRLINDAIRDPEVGNQITV